jgi:hypothetical protein
MAYRRNHPDFSVIVDGAFDEDGVWCIDAALQLRDGISEREKTALVGEARLELILGIAQAARHGRSLGSTSVRLQLDGDPEIVGHHDVVQAIRPD